MDIFDILNKDKIFLGLSDKKPQALITNTFEHMGAGRYTVKNKKIIDPVGGMRFYTRKTPQYENNEEVDKRAIKKKEELLAYVRGKYNTYNTNYIDQFSKKHDEFAHYAGRGVNYNLLTDDEKTFLLRRLDPGDIWEMFNYGFDVVEAWKLLDIRLRDTDRYIHMMGDLNAINKHGRSFIFGVKNEKIKEMLSYRDIQIKRETVEAGINELETRFNPNIIANLEIFFETRSCDLTKKDMERIVSAYNRIEDKQRQNKFPEIFQKFCDFMGIEKPIYLTEKEKEEEKIKTEEKLNEVQKQINELFDDVQNTL